MKKLMSFPEKQTGNIEELKESLGLRSFQHAVYWIVTDFFASGGLERVKRNRSVPEENRDRAAA